MKFECTEPHNDNCHYCSLFPFLIKEMLSLIDEIDTEILQSRKREMVYEVKECEEAVRLYKHQLIRNYASLTNWEQWFKKRGRNIAMLTMDWIMKFIGRKAREVTTEWWGKVCELNIL